MRRVIRLALAAFLALAPALAEARPGYGGSFGSRGSRTYQAAPGVSVAPGGSDYISESLTPRRPTPPYGAYGGGYRTGGLFGSGLLGGLIGAGLGGLLFGHGFFGGIHGGLGFLGLLLQFYLLYLVGSWVLRTLFGRPALAGGAAFAGGPRQRPAPQGGRVFAAPRRPVTLTQTDYQSFEAILKGIQAAWSAHDVNGLRAMATPEMVSYFAEQLTQQVSRGVRNRVSDVRLQQGNLSQAWSEGTRDYATVAMRFSIIDVTIDRAGHVVDGSPTERVTVTEFWTFVRVQGASWLLSAIQQPA